MIKLISSLFALCLILTRFYLIYKILQWLFTNFSEPNFQTVQWFLCAIILDMYVSSMDKVYDANIYMKKEDGQDN